MRYPWLFAIVPVVLSAIIGLAILRFRFGRKNKDRDPVFLAHSETIMALGEYKKAQRRYRRILWVAAALLLILVNSLTAVAARPTSVAEVPENYGRHDLMLCADTATKAFLDETLTAFAENLKNLHGERVGVTFFRSNANVSASVNLIPLTDDYATLSQALIPKIKTALIEHVAVLGADNTVKPQFFGAGYGAISCINNLNDLADNNRERALILLTDNAQAEQSTVSIAQAADYAQRYGVAFYVIAPLAVDDESDPEQAEQLIKGQRANDPKNPYTQLFNATIDTGGSYVFKCRDTREGVSVCGKSGQEDIRETVGKFLQLEAERTRGTPKTVQTDQPLYATLAALLSLTALMILVWRLGL